MLAVDDLALSYDDGSGGAVPVVDIAGLTAAAGELLAVTGPSGSGKSTLLYLLAGLERPNRGAVRWAGTDIFALGEARRDAWRRRNVGFVFQDFHLIEELDALGNVLVPALFERWSAGTALKARAATLLSGFGVPDGRRPVARLSRGERQRVALARALLFDPPAILADEPTASLDGAAGGQVIAALADLARAGKTVVAVSHDAALVAAADRVVRLDHGRVEAAA